MQSEERITSHIRQLEGWRGKTMAQLRKMIREAGPELAEEWKWNTPVWSHRGNVLAVGAFQDHIKVNFFKGASLGDPGRLFNAGLDARATRAIDIRQGDAIDDAALKKLVRAAIELNRKAAAKHQ
jgi:hypothetical protein